MKKTVVVLVVCLIASAVMPLAAFAHGHGRNRAVERPNALCSVENCNADGIHYHGETCYYGHYAGDGHDYHQICNVQGCVLTGVHEHDGVAYFCRYAEDCPNYNSSGCRMGLRY